MKRICRRAAIIAAMILVIGKIEAQVLNNGSGQYWLTPTNPLPRTFAIGNSFTSGYALDVHGEQMNPSLGNVFKTNADEHLDSYWRMFHGQDEFGQLFHLVDEKQFNINAPQGHLLLRTNDEWRMRINPKDPYSALGSFSNIPAEGFVGISPTKEFWGNGPGPFSRLHLAEPGSINAQAIGYRPWQRNGITFTGNEDQGYVGQKYREGGSGYTDMVMQWSDNPGNWKGDRLRFIFTSGYNPGSPTGMNSLEGLDPDYAVAIRTFVSTPCHC